MHVAGEPQARGSWRGAVANAAWPLTLARANISPDVSPDLGHVPEWHTLHPGPGELRLDFVVSHWVDLDSLVEVTLAGLRDARWYGRGLAGLQGILATKSVQPPASGRGEGRVRGNTRTPPGQSPGVRITGVRVAELEIPGPTALDVEHDEIPRSRGAVRRWRDALAEAWGDRPLLEDRESWLDLTFGPGGRGSLLGCLEGVMDALEPVLGRDPRGRTEMFPNDHLVTWLRARWGSEGSPAVHLRLGPRVDG